MARYIEDLISDCPGTMAALARRVDIAFMPQLVHSTWNRQATEANSSFADGGASGVSKAASDRAQYLSADERRLVEERLASAYQDTVKVLDGANCLLRR